MSQCALASYPVNHAHPIHLPSALPCILLTRHQENGTTAQPQMTVFSSRQPVGILQFLAGFGVIGLYVSIVLVVGRLIRAGMQGVHTRVSYTEMPTVDALQGLCHAIFLAREHRKLEVEEQLCMLLLEVYRLPNALRQWSGSLLNKELMLRQLNSSGNSADASTHR